jgi:hypothetical protein
MFDVQVAPQIFQLNLNLTAIRNGNEHSFPTDVSA